MKQKSSVMTCPQCDNVVRADAEICNICGKLLKTSNSKTLPVPPPAPVAVPISISQQQAAPPPPAPVDVEEDEEDEEEYEDDEEEEEYEDESEEQIGASQVMPATPGELLALFEHLQQEAKQIERYFPANLPGKSQKLTLWRKQLQRAQACAMILERPQLQQMDSLLKLRQHLSEAARALDFTRQYTVKLIGHAGAGKSTLLAALTGHDIFPRLAGGAVTGVRTRVYLCNEQAPEEMHVHFLTRSAFSELLKQTQQTLQQTQSSRSREALQHELEILQKANERYGQRYLQDEPFIERLPRDRWKEESSRYIEEPARNSDEPRLIRLIDYVEYNIHATPSAILPPGSVLVDLPGGSAGQLRHEAILREEMNEVDAIIMVIGNNRFGDDDRTLRLFNLLQRKIVQSRSPEVAAQMIFLAVTHWDEVNSAASVEKAQASLRPLLRELPANYSSYHHHGPRNDIFFYPLRGLDALFATLGKEKEALDSDRIQEGRDYAGRILSVYPELLQIDPTLPTTTSAQEFQQVSQQQHAAMLRFSGLPQLTDDLQHFLANNRYEVQLRQAETQLAIILQYLEDSSWDFLSRMGIHSHDLQELEYEMKMRQSKRGAMRFEQLQQRTSRMHEAWQDVLAQFDAMINRSQNAFYQALESAHERALRRIKLHIMQGHFDHFVKLNSINSRGSQNSPAMEIGSRWMDIDGWGLIKALRASFSSALERELNDPARTLAEAFLIPVAYKEEIDGTLDISRVALGERGGEMDEIQKAYNKLKRSIREKARDVCLYVTMGELLNEEKYAPTKDTPAVKALYQLAHLQGNADDISQQARKLMEPILEVICDDLARSTEQRIAHLFRYELDKLQARTAYESERLDAAPTRVPGYFTDLVNHLHTLLTERVITSEELRKQLDQLQAQREAHVDGWVELIRETEMLRTMHRLS